MKKKILGLIVWTFLSSFTFVEAVHSRIIYFSRTEKIDKIIASNQKIYALSAADRKIHIFNLKKLSRISNSFSLAPESSIVLENKPLDIFLVKGELAEELWILYKTSSKVSIIDLSDSSQENISELELDCVPARAYFEGETLWIYSEEGQCLQKIETQSRKVLKNIFVEGEPGQILTTQEGDWILYAQEHRLEFFASQESKNVKTQIEFENLPIQMLDAGEAIWVIYKNSSQVTALSKESGEIVGSFSMKSPSKILALVNGGVCVFGSDQKFAQFIDPRMKKSVQEFDLGTHFFPIGIRQSQSELILSSYYSLLLINKRKYNVTHIPITLGLLSGAYSFAFNDTHLFWIQEERVGGRFSSCSIASSVLPLDFFRVKALKFSGSYCRESESLLSSFLCEDRTFLKSLLRKALTSLRAFNTLPSPSEPGFQLKTTALSEGPVIELPIELWLLIQSELKIKDKIRLSRVSKNFQNILSTPQVENELLIRLFHCLENFDSRSEEAIFILDYLIRAGSPEAKEILEYLRKQKLLPVKNARSLEGSHKRKRTSRVFSFL